MSPIIRFFDRESKILHLLRTGEETGLVMLFEDARPMAESYLKRNSGTAEDAEELLQEAVVILWENVRRGTFEHEAKLTTYLMGVIKNLWARRLSARKRETPLSEQVDPPSEDDSALDALIRDEQVDSVRRAMERISEVCRKILLLFYWEERSMEEIAASMGLANADTAKSKKYQCRKNLERHLRELTDHA